MLRVAGNTAGLVATGGVVDCALRARMADASDGDSTFDVEAGAGAGRETGTETRAGETETARPPPPATPPLANAGAAQDIAISIAMEKVVFFMVFLSSTIAHSTLGYCLLLLRGVGCYRVGTLNQFKVIFITNAQAIVDVLLELLTHGNRSLVLVTHRLTVDSFGVSHLLLELT